MLPLPAAGSKQSSHLGATWAWAHRPLPLGWLGPGPLCHQATCAYWDWRGPGTTGVRTLCVSVPTTCSTVVIDLSHRVPTIRPRSRRPSPLCFLLSGCVFTNQRRIILILRMDERHIDVMSSLSPTTVEKGGCGDMTLPVWDISALSVYHAVSWSLIQKVDTAGTSMGVMSPWWHQRFDAAAELLLLCAKTWTSFCDNESFPCTTVINWQKVQLLTSK